jgi:signal transduction histidine kinase
MNVRQDNRLIGCATVVWDLIERRQLAREARRAKHFVGLGQLPTAVVHELRNPLGVVFLHIDIIEEHLQPPTAVNRPQQEVERRWV